MKNTIKVIVVDDESDSQELIGGILRDYYPDLNILGYAVNIDEAFEQIKKEKPALVYLDINLPRGSGVNLLERFPIRKFEVIVVSGYPENKQKLKRFRDIAFVEKPVSLEKFQQATDQALQSIKNDPHKVHRYDQQ